MLKDGQEACLDCGGEVKHLVINWTFIRQLFPDLKTGGFCDDCFRRRTREWCEERIPRKLGYKKESKSKNNFDSWLGFSRRRKT